MPPEVTPRYEASRLAALESYEILDTLPEQSFDDLTQIAAQVCGVPISLISLVDDHRQWFKSRVGLDALETPREMAFCAHALDKPSAVLTVEDALSDERFASNPLVTSDPFIRFYAGAPLVAPSQEVLGTLCVIDTQPRQLTEQQLQILQGLSRQVVALLESRRNEQKLREAASEIEKQRRETQLILDHVPAYVFYKDTSNTILRVNQAVADSLARGTAEIEGKHAKEVYPEQAEQYYRDDLEVLRSRKPKLGIVEPLVTDSGEQRWIRTDKIPTSSRGDDVDGILVVASDITELKRIEESLRQTQHLLQQANASLEKDVERKTQELASSKRRYEDLYHNAPDMFASVSIRTGCVIECNNTLLHKTGYKRREIIGQPVSKLYHPDCTADVQAMFKEFQERGRFDNREVLFARKDGSPIVVSLSSSAIIDDDGAVIASRSVCRDITEKKQLEEESLQRLEQLTHLSRVATMSEMATGLAHEINQPLYAIKNYASGALKAIKGRSYSEDVILGALNAIVSDADRAAELIKSIRRFVQPQRRRTEKIAPLLIARRAAELLPSEYRKLGITVTVSADADSPAIKCDEVQIEQVALNLILNAAEAVLEANAPQKNIDIRIKRSGSEQAEFSVIDAGPGFPQDDAERLFDAFYTTKDEGLGMGLAICRTIIKAHGGTITAKANSEAGVTVSFCI